MVMIIPNPISGSCFDCEGNINIHGTQIGIESPRRIILHELSNGRAVRSTWSIAGTYSFYHLADRDYYVVGIDHENIYNNAVAAKPPKVVE